MLKSVETGTKENIKEKPINHVLEEYKTMVLQLKKKNNDLTIRNNELTKIANKLKDNSDMLSNKLIRDKSKLETETKVN